MRRYFILLCVISRVSVEMQAVGHFYMARKERCNSPPINTGYVYNQINNQPSKILIFGTKSHDNEYGDKEKRRLAALTTKMTPQFSSEPNISENTSKKPFTQTENIVKAKIKKSPKRNVLYDEPDIESSNNLAYYEKKDFPNDEQDVRTDLSYSNDGWPFFYHDPYVYEPMKFDSEIEKALDKRFIMPEEKRVIPVHEHISEDNMDNQEYSTVDFTYSTDNPMLGNQAFFSYVLNDYFDKTDDDDPSSFKGLTWGKEFDQEMSFHDIDDYTKRLRRLEEDQPSHKKMSGENKLDQGSLQVIKGGDSQDSKQEIKENTSGSKNEHNSNSYNNNKAENNRRFKNFADYFANRFGSVDHNNIFNHDVKNNIDKGEKKKGFRNVYHKDEYQEHTEFHDNNNKKDDYDSKGQSKIRIGGSERFLNSQAAAVIGSDENQIGKSEDNNNQQYINNNKLNHKKSNRNNFSQYRDVAKKAARSNNADYIDRFMD